jgi:large subunit ribosomal protein L21
MFAVIKTGGKQYKVEKDQILAVEKLNHGVGSVFVFDQVLSVTDGSKVTLGSAVGDVKVSAEILEQKRAEKVLVFKKRRRHNYRRKNGHRQYLSIIKVTDIAPNLTPKLLELTVSAKGGSVKAEATAPKAEKAPKAPKAEKAAAPAKKPAAKKATAAKTTTKKAATKKADA